MKVNTMRLIYLGCFILLFVQCVPAQNDNQSQPISVTEKDKEILDQIFVLFQNENQTPTSVLMTKLGIYFLGTPYAARTLETESEHLVVNLREMDCSTLAENCLAISKTLQSGNRSFDRFYQELEKIRYRNGKINGYPSRLHYTSDWIYDNQQKKLVKDVTNELTEGVFYPNKVNYMSSHPESYVQLKDSSQLVNEIIKQEKIISARQYYFVPEEKLAEVENQLMDGDIIGITTKINGLDVLHMAILIRKNDRIHMIHASSSAGKVIVSEETLEEYLLNSQMATGIIVSRPV